MSEANPFASPLAVNERAPVDGSPVAVFPSLRRVRTGLGLIRIGLLLMLVSVVASPLVNLYLARYQGPNALAGWALATAVLSLAIALLVLVGGGLCLAVPRTSGARELAVCVVFLQVGLLLLSFVVPFLVVPSLVTPQQVRVVLLTVGIVRYLFWFAWLFALLMFFYRLARFLGRRDLVAHSRRLMICGAIAAGARLIVVSATLAGAPQSASVTFAVAVGIATAVTLAYSIWQLTRLRQAITV